MAIGGVVQMLSPQTIGLASKQSAITKLAAPLWGNNRQLRQSVPLLYGRRPYRWRDHLPPVSMLKISSKHAVMGLLNMGVT